MERIAVYTAVFGGYEGSIPQPAQPGIDYIRFTDASTGSRSWDERLVERRFEDPVRESRWYKVLPHACLPGYNISVYVDANFLVTGDIRALAQERLSRKNMAVFSHAATLTDPRDCVYKEYASLMKMGNLSGRFKDDPGLMTRQIERYRREGYPERNGLVSAAVLLRKHHEPDVVRAMRRWWSEIEGGSRRDQLSIDYSLWKEGLACDLIEEDLRSSRWFQMIAHHRKSYTLPLLRYRLRGMLGITKRR